MKVCWIARIKLSFGFPYQANDATFQADGTFCCVQQVLTICIRINCMASVNSGHDLHEDDVRDLIHRTRGGFGLRSSNHKFIFFR